ncbi:uncharacterized protein LOC126902328 [Daktulosphaira vitifoliae]|uniref:uncharacterized protein LOC126902328 n=1 Tax=Daktulosphaira vitifoliae TaxID=58002 RepID=UPI0021A9CEB6|nr:uncharacterized protein LOC126902328 [Daktulosphaira vitifoliae]
MKISLLLILIMTIKVSFSGYMKDLMCSHTRYFLNFFNHNERFLLELEKKKDNITIENVMNYGKALQTHSKVIMIFMEDLTKCKPFIFPFSLIMVNMYLNNVSGSLNMIAQNEGGEKDNAPKLLKGYKIIHFAVKKQLKYSINEYCKNVEFNESLVSCNPYIIKNEYTTTNLVNINNKLKDEIMMKFNYIIEKNKYEYYHPKKFLFFDIMTQQILSNKNNTIKIDNSKHIVLNLLRFTPLNVRCTNGTHLYIQNVFEYMKYNFHSKDVLIYINLVISATFRPIAILIRNFLTLIQVACSKNSDSVKFWLKSMFIKVGHKIMSYINSFISLRLFNLSQKFLEYVLYTFTQVLYDYIKNVVCLELDHEINNLLIKKLSNFFIKKNLFFTSDLALTNQNINESNADEIKNDLEKIMKKVEIYLNDLNKWKDSFNLISNKSRILCFSASSCKELINFKVKDRICNTESHIEIHNASTNDRNNIEIGYYEDKECAKDDITEFSLKDLKDDLVVKDISTNDSLENQSTYKPLYMIDYWPYNV